MRRQSIKDRLDSAKQIIMRDNISKTVVKATTEEEIPPKEKHLTVLEQFTRDTFTPMPDMVVALKNRIISNNWLVTAKTIMTIHHLLINGEERFALYLSSNLSIFSNLFNFPESLMMQNKDIINFLKNYSVYLKCKLEIYYKIGIDMTRSASTLNFEERPAKDLLQICNNMNVLAKSVFYTQIHKYSISSKMLVFIFDLLYIDVSRLYCCYSSVMSSLLKQFYKVNKKIAKNIFDEFECYMKYQYEFELFFNAAKELKKNDVPEVEMIKSDVFDNMKSYINSEESGQQNSAPFLTMEEEKPQEKPQPSEQNFFEDLFSTDHNFNQPSTVQNDNFGLFTSDNVAPASQDIFQGSNFSFNSNNQPQSTPTPQFSQQGLPQQVSQQSQQWSNILQNYQTSQPSQQQYSQIQQQTYNMGMNPNMQPPQSQFSYGQMPGAQINQSYNLQTTQSQFSYGQIPSQTTNQSYQQQFQVPQSQFSYGQMYSQPANQPYQSNIQQSQFSQNPMNPQPTNQSFNQTSQVFNIPENSSKEKEKNDPFDFFGF